MTLTYLWVNRERPRLYSRRWIKVWAKRFVHSAGLLSVVIRRALYKLRGAKAGRLTIIEKVKINGRWQRLSIGERSFIGTNVLLTLHNNIIIGDRVVINNNVQLLTGSHDTKDPSWRLISKPIVIHDYAWVASSAIILPGVTIGNGAVVGAGAVVSRDVPDWAVVTGNPARVVGRRCEELRYSPIDLSATYEAWLGRNAQGEVSTANHSSYNDGKKCSC